MSEHPADRAIGADWHPPRQVQKQKAWDTLDATTRDEFYALQNAGWKDQLRIEQLDDEPPESAWAEYELLPPAGSTDEPKRIGRWPLKVEDDEKSRVRAIGEEWDEFKE